MDGQKMPFCGKPVYKLCNSRIFIHRNFRFYMKLLLRPRTKRLIIPTDREAFGWNDPPDQEAFGWNGPPGREVFGRNGPPGREAFGRNDPPDQEVFGRNDPPGREVFGWNDPPGQKAFGWNGPWTRKSSDGMVHGSGSLRAERSDGS